MRVCLLRLLRVACCCVGGMCWCVFDNGVFGGGVMLPCGVLCYVLVYECHVVAWCGMVWCDCGFGLLCFVCLIWLWLRWLCVVCGVGRCVCVGVV